MAVRLRRGHAGALPVTFFAAGIGKFRHYLGTVAWRIQEPARFARGVVQVIAVRRVMGIVCAGRQRDAAVQDRAGRHRDLADHRLPPPTLSGTYLVSLP
jgi:hypothetical protein